MSFWSPQRRIWGGGRIQNEATLPRESAHRPKPFGCGLSACAELAEVVTVPLRVFSPRSVLFPSSVFQRVGRGAGVGVLGGNGMPVPAATEGASISTGSLKPENLKVMVTVNLVPSERVMSPNSWEPAAF